MFRQHLRELVAPRLHHFVGDLHRTLRRMCGWLGMGDELGFI
jgi:hypothetical protein